MNTKDKFASEIIEVQSPDLPSVGSGVSTGLGKQLQNNNTILIGLAAHISGATKGKHIIKSTNSKYVGAVIRCESKELVSCTFHQRIPAISQLLFTYREWECLFRQSVLQKLAPR